MVVIYNPMSTYKTYSTNGRLSIYNHPVVNITNTDKINDIVIDSDSHNVLILSGDTFEMDFKIEYHNEQSLENTKGYRYEIFKFNPKTKVFNQKIFESDIFVDENYFGQRHNTKFLSLDGDYIIKNYFTFKDEKLFKNCIFKEGNGDTEIKDGIFEYGFYNKYEDNYLVLINKPEIPTLFSHTKGTPEKDVIKSLLLKPNGTKKIIVDEKINGEIILTFNGLVLAKNLDFTFNDNIIEFVEETKKNDIINIFYTSKGETLSVEVFDINDINKTENVNYNNTHNRYELIVTRGFGGKKEIITLNGLVLTPNLDYVRSNTDNTKIILMGELKDNDLITIVYTPKLSIMGEIQNTKPSLGWYLSKNPTSSNGEFLVEISKYYDFREILFNKTIPYDVNNNVYKTDLDFELESFTDYHYRVINHKTHTTVNGSKINLSEKSEQYHFKIINNQINTY